MVQCHIFKRQYPILFVTCVFSSEREYEETGSEGEQAEEIEGEGDGDVEEEMDVGEERVEEEQEGGEDHEMIEEHQRNHIGIMFRKVTIYSFKHILNVGN